MRSEAERKAQSKYDQNNTKKFVLKLNTRYDADVIKKLESTGNRQGYIKSLIRNEMRNSGNVLDMDSIRYLILPVIKQYQLHDVSLFGSYARGEARSDSDIDLLIGDCNVKGLFGYLELQEKLEAALGKRVDLVTEKALEENRSVSGQYLKNNIERDKVELYVQH